MHCISQCESPSSSEFQSMDGRIRLYTVEAVLGVAKQTKYYKNWWGVALVSILVETMMTKDHYFDKMVSQLLFL